MNKYAFLWLCITGVASGQAISFGVKGGVPFTEAIRYRDESRPYVIGGTVEVRLPAHFAIEADALYQRVGTSSGVSFLLSGVNLIPINSSVQSFTNRLRGNSWEFPLLAKYYFRPHHAGWEPFLATGYSFRTIRFKADTVSVISGTDIAPSTVRNRSSYTSALDVGATLAAGLRLRSGRFAISPEIRYTRWGGSENNSSQLQRNEAKFLLGITF